MIERLDAGQVTPSKSPNKRGRTSRATLRASNVSDESAHVSGRPVTESSLQSSLRSMADLLKTEISSEFRSLKEDLGSLFGRMEELERHISMRDDHINKLEQCIRTRDERIFELDQLDGNVRQRDLLLSGSAVPSAPKEHWNEDVVDTILKLLRNMLSTSFSEAKRYRRSSTIRKEKEHYLCDVQRLSQKLTPPSTLREQVPVENAWCFGWFEGTEENHLQRKPYAVSPPDL